MIQPTLVLFDIDGTILTSGGAGETALRLGFFEEFGLEENLTQIEISGRTDSGIARQVLAKHGIEASDENLRRFFEGYLRQLQRQLPVRTGRLLPGILPLIQTLREMPHVCLGLLTGNLERGAALKLQHYGVGDIFKFGAFADDHHDRNQLGAIALARALEASGVAFEAARTFVLGDTPHDIHCARACGARAVAVATGSFSLEQLSPFEPDTLFPDFSDLPSVMRALGLGA